MCKGCVSGEDIYMLRPYYITINYEFIKKCVINLLKENIAKNSKRVLVYFGKKSCL